MKNECDWNRNPTGSICNAMIRGQQSDQGESECAQKQASILWSRSSSWFWRGSRSFYLVSFRLVMLLLPRSFANQDGNVWGCVCTPQVDIHLLGGCARAPAAAAAAAAAAGDHHLFLRCKTRREAPQLPVLFLFYFKERVAPDRCRRSCWTRVRLSVRRLLLHHLLLFLFLSYNITKDKNIKMTTL